ncbi:hypothetical protein [Nonomuraea wenchangensis]|uniref:Uncharacterized protein n=1 Tax=Nonomuraea wenchangensis TaxID=568860 RepID=A0A1I0H024_9ACTN|nr:hypothetical protein [Nonomuraea wenchangensis]SET76875.1 hypothetical protein SAMN05421811_10446 [Nonomuraea wenchangensis]
MDGFHPRLLAGDFAAAFRFYDAVLPELIGAERMKGTEAVRTLTGTSAGRVC